MVPLQSVQSYVTGKEDTRTLMHTGIVHAEKQLERLNESLLRGVGRGIQSISAEAGIHEASSSHQQLQALGRYLSILKPYVVKLEVCHSEQCCQTWQWLGYLQHRIPQAESDFIGATELRRHVQEQQKAFDAFFVSKRQEESQKTQEHLASVARWEASSHVQDWNSLVQSIRGQFHNRRVCIYSIDSSILFGSGGGQALLDIM